MFCPVWCCHVPVLAQDMKANSHSSSCEWRLSREQTTSHPCAAFTQRICRRFRSLRMYLQIKPTQTETLRVRKAAYCYNATDLHENLSAKLKSAWLRGSEARSTTAGDGDWPVQWFEATHIQWQSVLRTGVVMDQPGADAGAAESMFTGCLEGALQHISTYTAQ